MTPPVSQGAAAACEVSRPMPLSALPQLSAHAPLFLSRVSAGFPSPADDFLETSLNLHQFLVKHPAATFFVRVSGTSMIRAGIHPNDLLIVDRSLAPKDGKVILAVLQGEFTVKRLTFDGNQPVLIAENEGYPPIPLHEDADCHLWGVVTYVIHGV